MPENPKVKVEVRRTGRRFDAVAVIDLAADPRIVWDTITDYDALPRFMPGIRECRVIERHAPTKTTEQLRVEQHGDFRFLLFGVGMTVHLDIRHEARRVAHARAERIELGSFPHDAIEIFEGRYEIESLPAKKQAPQTRLSYSAVIGLRLPPPPAIGSVAVRQNLAAQLEAVAREVAQRTNRSARPATRKR